MTVRGGIEAMRLSLNRSATRTTGRARTGFAAGTLASVVGIAVAEALFGFIPKAESGRKVDATVAEDGTATVRHISGPQYLRTYLDVIGVATACDGITTLNGKPMPRNHTFTEAECTALLEKELVAHARPAMACTPGIALSDDPATERRREGPRFLAVSLAYNVGVGNYCGSTAARRFNEQRYDEGCQAATRWNRAGGRVLRGLVSRRNDEALVCTDGLAALARIL